MELFFGPDRGPVAGRSCGARQSASAADRGRADAGRAQLCQPARARIGHQPSAAPSAFAEARGGRTRHLEAGDLLRRQGAQLLRSRQIRFRTHPGGHRGRRQIAHRFQVKGKTMSPTVYFISMGAMFGTIILVFGIRFLQASAVAGADAAHTDAYRKLAADAVTAKAGNAATLSAVQSELTELKTRLRKAKKILKVV